MQLRFNWWSLYLLKVQLLTDMTTMKTKLGSQNVNQSRIPLCMEREKDGSVRKVAVEQSKSRRSR